MSWQARWKNAARTSRISVAYRTEAETPDSPAAERIYRMLLDGQIDAVTFTAPPRFAGSWLIIGEEQAVDLLGTTIVAAIGPVTAAAALEIRHHATIVADTFSGRGTVRAGKLSLVNGHRANEHLPAKRYPCHEG